VVAASLAGCGGASGGGESSGPVSTTAVPMTWGTGADEAEAPREDIPSRPVPPPFELPEGCGDGVVVPGQYDCFIPTDLEYLNDPAADHGGDPRAIASNSHATRALS
jgi:hypothetical protein